MKKWIAGIGIAILLCGCGAQPTFETVTDDDALPVLAVTRKIDLDLPKDASQPVMKTDGGDTLYICNGYTLTMQTLPGGDLDRTMRQITGYGKNQLRSVRTRISMADRYDLVWSAAGEGGDQVLRAVVLDDSQNHYVITVSADAENAGDLQKTWNQLLRSVSLRTDSGIPGTDPGTDLQPTGGK